MEEGHRDTDSGKVSEPSRSQYAYGGPELPWLLLPRLPRQDVLIEASRRQEGVRPHGMTPRRLSERTGRGILPESIMYQES